MVFSFRISAFLNLLLFCIKLSRHIPQITLYNFFAFHILPFIPQKKNLQIARCWFSTFYHRPVYTTSSDEFNHFLFDLPLFTNVIHLYCVTNNPNSMYKLIISHEFMYLFT